MGDDFDRDDPHVGPDHLPGPDVGATFTFDFDGHPQSVDVDVPGTAEGSDPAHIDFGGGDRTTPPDPGWMPTIPDPGAATFDPLSVPPPPGWHRDPITGVEFLDQPAPPPDAWAAPADQGPGDFPLPDPDPDQAVG